MATFIIGYDLNRPGQNYPELLDAIKGLGSRWWHHLDSTWIVVTNLTAAQIRDKLQPHIDRTDELLVVQSGGVGAWVGFNNEGSQWLQTNL